LALCKILRMKKIKLALANKLYQGLYQGLS
jgi:hypothetical protein